MPWCPKCRNEYREGFTVCADCGVALVDVLGAEEKEKSVIYTSSKEEIEHIYEFLTTSDIRGVSTVDAGEGFLSLMVEEDHRKEVNFALNTYFEKRKEEAEEFFEKQRKNINKAFSDDDEEKGSDEESGESSDKSDDSQNEDSADDSDDSKVNNEESDEDENEDDEDEEEDKPGKSTAKKNEKAFRSSKEKADDALTSAFSLCIIGVIGLCFEALVVFHVIPLQINGTPGYVLYGFMACVFLFLCISGISSFFTAKRLRSTIVDETNTKDEIIKFLKEEAVETANKLIKDNDDKNDETVYFARMEFLKRAVKAEPKFKDVDDVTLDGLLDENYHDLFADA